MSKRSKNLIVGEHNFSQYERKPKDSRPININIQTRREQILKDARSFGAYLWTSNDLRNALLWFEETNDQNLVPFEDETSSSSNCKKKELNEKRICRNDFLRTLLFNRGVLDHCPGRIRTKKNVDNDSIFCKRKIVSKEDADDAFMTLKKNRLKRNRDQEPLLKHVIKAYWNSSSINILNESSLFIRPKSKHENKNSSSKNRHGEHPTKSLCYPKLQEHIIDVATARLMTQKLYNLSKNTSKTTQWAEKRTTKTSLDLLESRLSSQNKNIATIQALQILINSIHASNGYFSSSETAIMRAYATQLYIRLLAILRTSKELPANLDDGFASEDAQKVHLEEKNGMNNENETAIQFLKKLRKLSLHDQRIQQVHLLMLLVPQLLSSQKGPSTSIHANKISSHDLGVQSILCDSVLTCARELVSAAQKNKLVNSGSFKSIEEDSDLLNQSSLWNINSFLLCAVSNVHSQIGKVYINHLVNAAIIVYCNNSDGVPSNELNHSTNYQATPGKSKRMSMLNHCSKEQSNEFMDRLIHLGATSESLLSLIFDVLHSIEFKLTVDARNKIENVKKTNTQNKASTPKRNTKELEVVHFIMDELEELFPFFDVSNKF